MYSDDWFIESKEQSVQPLEFISRGRGRILCSEGVHMLMFSEVALYEGESVTRSPEVVLIIPNIARVRTRNKRTTLSRPRFIGHYLVFNPVKESYCFPLAMFSYVKHCFPPSLGAAGRHQADSPTLALPFLQERDEQEAGFRWD
ncbi:hypothetical protein E2C01_049774 [Portunus trituberculatus]|uniref:Uncharacterized protein n=1 Tax=Portunus trituberculatus TaxID=210409 RepID=A0A5B7GE05_PORTR|nr:hypothetical protein [Portunus trituberculatus]